MVDSVLVTISFPNSLVLVAHKDQEVPKEVKISSMKFLPHLKNYIRVGQLS